MAGHGDLLVNDPLFDLSHQIVHVDFAGSGYVQVGSLPDLDPGCFLVRGRRAGTQAPDLMRQSKNCNPQVQLKSKFLPNSI